MTTKAEYTTVADVRAAILNQAGTADDALILQFIRTASKDIDAIAVQKFAPVIETRYFDGPGLGGGWAQLYADRYTMDTKALGARELVFDAPLLELTALTNGDGTLIASSEYVLEPYNQTPKQRVTLLRSSSTTFVQNAASDYQKVLSVAGVWGYHDDYANAWVDTATTLAAPIATTTAAAFTSSNGAALKAGWLAKIDSEYLYISGIGSSVSVLRGVNGSTAATHTTGAAVSYWEVMYQIQTICSQAATLYYNIRNNPGVAMVVDGHVISKPSDVRKFITDSLNFLGENREAFA
jgi:hypothetical protein